VLLLLARETLDLLYNDTIAPGADVVLDIRHGSHLIARIPRRKIVTNPK
jgi:hypothetical protein